MVDFIEFMLNVQLENSGVKRYELTETDYQAIHKISAEKFETWEWNYGYSPKYSFQNRVEIDGRGIEIRLKVIKGIISESEVKSDYFSNIISAQISERIQNKRHFF